MNPKMAKFISYYRPYWRLFLADMACACIAAGINLAFPLLVRYLTNDVLQNPGGFMVEQITKVASVMVFLTVVEYFCNFFITSYGHIMGAKMEYDLRNELFNHFQKLSFSYYDNQKTGQIMSRLTNDLFEITELYHHGPEDLLISLFKLTGSFIILFGINARLTLIVFTFIPLMVWFAYYYNRKMRQAFKKNRAKIAEINAGIEDSISGVRVVKSFANEEVELDKFRENNARYVASKRNSYYYMGRYHSGINAFSSLIYVAVVIGAALL
ncbi:MAG TPA: ABC transporter ATP-binding protein, partial [Bacillota bacterium]|nr:ABC transporter ATP-binding protein [Bacillota bacterium]